MYFVCACFSGATYGVTVTAHVVRVLSSNALLAGDCHGNPGFIRTMNVTCSIPGDSVHKSCSPGGAHLSQLHRVKTDGELCTTGIYTTATDKLTPHYNRHNRQTHQSRCPLYCNFLIYSLEPTGPYASF